MEILTTQSMPKKQNTIFANILTCESSNYARLKRDEKDVKQTLQTILMYVVK